MVLKSKFELQVERILQLLQDVGGKGFTWSCSITLHLCCKHLEGLLPHIQTKTQGSYLCLSLSRNSALFAQLESQFLYGLLISLVLLPCLEILLNLNTLNTSSFLTWLAFRVITWPASRALLVVDTVAWPFWRLTLRFMALIKRSFGTLIRVLRCIRSCRCRIKENAFKR